LCAKIITDAVACLEIMLENGLTLSYRNTTLSIFQWLIYNAEERQCYDLRCALIQLQCKLDKRYMADTIK